MTLGNQAETISGSKLPKDSKNSTAKGQLAVVWSVQSVKVEINTSSIDFCLAGGERFDLHIGYHNYLSVRCERRTSVRVRVSTLVSFARKTDYFAFSPRYYFRFLPTLSHIGEEGAASRT